MKEISSKLKVLEEAENGETEKLLNKKTKRDKTMNIKEAEEVVETEVKKKKKKKVVVESDDE